MIKCIVLLILHLNFMTCNAQSTLKLVHVVFRHGDRSPVTIFPKDVNKIDNWPDGLGWLTTTGMKQHFELGKWLRQRYGGFLNSSYVHSEINIESSDENRCLMSAYSNLAGLYPPKGKQLWNTDVKWQPIPVHTRPEKEDNVINMGMPCPKYDQLYQQLLQSDEIQKEEQTNKEFYKLVGEKSGWTHENISNIWRVADTLFCEKAHNFKPNSWAEKPAPNDPNMTVYEKLRQLDSWQFGLMYQGKQLSKFKGGPLLKEIINNTWQMVHKRKSVKFYMYSGHDTTVAALLSALQLFNKKSPPYAAMDIIELHKNSTDFFVRIFYKNTTDTAYQLQLPGCSMDCMLNDFMELTKNVIPKDWNAECGLPAPTPGQSSSTTKLTLPMIVSIILGSLLLILLVIMVATCIHYQRKTGGNYNRFTNEINT